ELRHRFWSELAGVDVIVAPTLPVLPPRLDQLVEDESYFRFNGLMLRNTAPFNALGSPALSMPVPGWRSAEGLSAGLMLAARAAEEELLVGLAVGLEGGSTANR